MKFFKEMSFVIFLVLFWTLILSGTALADRAKVFIGALEPNWTLGVFSLYCGPPDYEYVSPGSTAEYLGREAGIIKAGLEADPSDGHYWDDGCFAFRPNVTIEELADNPLTYDVVNQFGTNPVWMTIELDTGNSGDRNDNTTFQMVPAPYGSVDYVTVNANAAEQTWYRWLDDMGTTDSTPWTLEEIAEEYPGVSVVRTYLRLGMGDSYAPDANGTQAWVDKATIGGVTYDFVVKGKGFTNKDWGTNPGHHGFKNP